MTNRWNLLWHVNMCSFPTTWLSVLKWEKSRHDNWKLILWPWDSFKRPCTIVQITHTGCIYYVTFSHILKIQKYKKKKKPMSISCSKGTSFGYLSSYLLVILKVYCFFILFYFFWKKSGWNFLCMYICVYSMCMYVCIYILYIDNI